jgi:maleylpyruvate isomerase
VVPGWYDGGTPPYGVWSRQRTTGASAPPSGVVLDEDMSPDRTAERELATRLLGDASARLVRSVDAFREDDWAAPSLLPGWTRAHVVAHLALNAEAITGALRGLVADEGDEPRGGAAPMYESDEARESDIGELATADPAEIRDRLLAGTTTLDDAVAAVPDDAWDTRIERTPGGRQIRADALPGMRLRELEIHHVDLDAGYTSADWSPEFAEHLLDAMTKRKSPTSFEVRPLDSARTWVFGSADAEYPVPVVTGPAADLGRWLTGRPAPDTLHCSHGELPEIGAW